MYKFLILIIIIVMLFYLKFNLKIKIKYKTFLKRGFVPVRGNFGVYCYCGKQGTGKTYSVVEYLQDNKKTTTVFCNIKGITGFNYFYFTGFKELIKIKKILDYNIKEEEGLFEYILSLEFSEERAKLLLNLIKDLNENDKQLVIVYDEIFTELQKKSNLSKDVIDFLCQMRKRKIIFLTTAQEWAEIPLSFRRFCRYQINCKMIGIFGIGILFKTFRDAENMKWSNEEQEHIAPLIENTVTKCRKSIGNSYDTFLRISSVEE